MDAAGLCELSALLSALQDTRQVLAVLRLGPPTDLAAPAVPATATATATATASASASETAPMVEAAAAAAAAAAGATAAGVQDAALDGAVPVTAAAAAAAAAAVAGAGATAAGAAGATAATAPTASGDASGNGGERVCGPAAGGVCWPLDGAALGQLATHLAALPKLQVGAGVRVWRGPYL